MGTVDFNEMQKDTMDILYNYPAEEMDVVVNIVSHRIDIADEVKHKYPENSDNIDKYVKWLKSDFIKEINKRASKTHKKYTL